MYDVELLRIKKKVDKMLLSKDVKYLQGYEQGREDAISEMVDFFDNKAICINDNCIHMDDEYNCVRCIADQLKEHNNE